VFSGGGDSGEPDETLFGFGLAVRGHDGLCVQAKDLSRVFDVAESGWSQSYATPVGLQQRNPDVAGERRHRRGHRGLGDDKCRGCGAHRAMFGDRDEDAQSGVGGHSRMMPEEMVVGSAWEVHVRVSSRPRATLAHVR
jgi:hypothetical protein